jgi:hypothetical protein
LKRCPKRPVRARRHWRDFGPTESLDCCYWPVTSFSGAHRNVRFQVRVQAAIRRLPFKMARSLMTHLVALLRGFGATQHARRAASILRSKRTFAALSSTRRSE